MQKGFTLIELLVVIAIIGILASIVLVSFPGATARAHDSRIISAIGQARTVMVYAYANDGDYDGFTTALPAEEMVPITNEVANNGGTLHVNTNTESDEACIWSPLNSTSPGYYCADSTGTAGYTDTDPSGTCPDTPGTAAVCPDDVEG
jgi:prepilin-type N-terminal cleavage/methylation domain-containing protein